MSAKKKIVLILAAIALLISLSAYDAFYSAPSRITVRYETLQSIYIPDQLDDVQILFFSDLKYGTYMDQERTQKVIDHINDLAPDAVIFGGDLFEDTVEGQSEEDLTFLTEELKQIEAPLGKFAVLGDTDCVTQERQDAVRAVLYDADFEVLDNTSIRLHNSGSQAITLVGLQNLVNGSPDVDSAFANVSPTSYSLVVCHTPDEAGNVPTDRTNYFLAGHSLGGQAYWGLGALYTPAGAEMYLRGRHTISDAFTLDITTGVGTTMADVRFLADAELVVYTLKHTVINDQTAQ